jgi:hypothetical protein
MTTAAKYDMDLAELSIVDPVPHLLRRGYSGHMGRFLGTGKTAVLTTGSAEHIAG